ncbi:MAG: 50S ribosomal protein L19e [Candidatus Micrarchaeota archaeon]|nr:50S ribosomal protein L19e [Candidatus Micrarchaeota archaeon]
MGMDTVRRIAAQLLSAGESRIKFKPEALSKISEALTREDVRALIKEGVIYAEAKRGVCRVRARERARQLAKRRRRGMGSRKGTASARLDKKRHWIAKVRAQRSHLSMLVKSGRLPSKEARRIYRMIKGNAFRGVKAMETYLHDNKLLREHKAGEPQQKK